MFFLLLITSNPLLPQGDALRILDRCFKFTRE